jgi:hypothetical protein
VRERRDEAHGGVGQKLPEWLEHPDPDVKYYAVILAGLLKAQAHVPAMKALLAAAPTPAYLRKEIYQAFGNFEDGAYIDFLQSARKSDRACDEEIRDVLRALKRERIEAIR